MKRILILTIISTLILGACNSKDETSKADVESESNDAISTESETIESADESDSDKEVKSGTLLNEGEWTMDGLNKVTLVKIKDVNETYTFGPINLTIESVKFLHHSEVDEGIKNQINSIHGKDVTELNTIQIIYHVENTSDSNITFRAVDTITTDTKAQISGIHDLATSNDTGIYMGQVIVDGLKIFPYVNGSLEDINSIYIITSDVYDNDISDKLSDGKKIEIKF